MRISRDALKGYILEEVLAYLVRTTGYKLLVDSSQDPRDLENRGNGLVVRGRGGVHQADVLGQLEWIPAFTYPLRLFVEAKFRNDKTGIDVVRNAIGVILDINQNSPPVREQSTFPQKYQYVYALFSTSGFSKPAMEMALAHQISLIDLSGDEYLRLRRSIGQSADSIVRRIDSAVNGEGHGLDEMPISSRGRLVSGVRSVIRRKLETLPAGIQYPEYDIPMLEDVLESVIEVARQYGELFVAMANGPYMLLMKADDPIAFLEYARNHPRHGVLITWSQQNDYGRTWRITPSEDETAYGLSFRLPEILSRWIFGVSDNIRRRAFQIKEEYFSTITIYRHIEGRDCLFRLEFDLEKTRRHVQVV